MINEEPFLPPTVNGRPRRIPLPKLDPDSGCWIWQAAKANGYGKLGGPKSKPEWAHRVYYELAFGQIPERYQIHHACENKLCVNPQHLRALSPRRHAQQGSRAKLNIAQVREIRYRLQKGEKAAALSEEFDVTQNTIGDIRSGRSWQERVNCPKCGHRFDPFEFTEGNDD